MRKRVTKILNSLEDGLRSHLLDRIDSNTFAGAVVDARNDLTHYGDLNGEGNTTIPLSRMNRSLEGLLVVLLLRQIGLSDEQMLAAFQRTL